LTHLFREKGLTAVKFLKKVIFNKKMFAGQIKILGGQHVARWPDVA
jgi:hypothetical protein